MKIKVNRTDVIYDSERAAKSEIMDCAVRATAAALDITYDEAHEAYASVGREHRRGVHTYMITDVIKQFVIGWKQFNCMEKFANKVYWDRTKCPTVNQVMKDPKFKVGSHIMVTRNHVFTIKNGEIYGNRNDNGRARIEGYFTVNQGCEY